MVISLMLLKSQVWAEMTDSVSELIQELRLVAEVHVTNGNELGGRMEEAVL